MSFIIVWKNGHRDPFVATDDRYFLDTYSSYENAEKAAKEMEDDWKVNDRQFFDYQIYEEAQP